MAQTEIKIENITLSGLVFTDDLNHTGIRSDVAKTLDGGLVIWETSEPAGQLITLSGGDDFGWLERSTLQSLQAMASVPGASYTLTTPSDTITVRFRNESPPAIEATPLVARPNPATGDYYNKVTIKLMKI